MHMVYYLYGQRNQGIMFNSNGNTEPICYYDTACLPRLHARMALQSSCTIEAEVDSLIADYICRR